MEQCLSSIIYSITFYTTFSLHNYVYFFGAQFDACFLPTVATEKIEQRGMLCKGDRMMGCFQSEIYAVHSKASAARTRKRYAILGRMAKLNTFQSTGPAHQGNRTRSPVPHSFHSKRFFSCPVHQVLTAH